ncbi:hypothetical protein BGZ96_001643 [Linnemannia gamsii]|uniref:Chitin-binding type-3 domain-containing protein n=1 Tax=Linnemannia gamsii TaxID=64522 RepID=A0ABQ7JM80_9FUNG|nr:hypothetical protein BGZ96_001643 [Linnemannia gamsii]
MAQILVGAAAGVIATGIWKGLEALVDSGNDDRAVRNKEVVRGFSDKHPGWTFIICWVEHRCDGYTEKTIGIDPQRLMLEAYTLYAFSPEARGRFELIGDGGYLNWAIHGHFNRHENVCDIIGPSSQPNASQSSAAMESPTWTQGQFYAQGTVVRFEGADFVCLQDHTAAGFDWTPPNVPAIWRKQ